MARSQPPRSNLQEMLDGTLLKALSVLFTVGIFCFGIGYYLGKREELSDHNLAMIKETTECAEKVNREIDLRREAENNIIEVKVNRIEKGVNKLDSLRHEKN